MADDLTGTKESVRAGGQYSTARALSSSHSSFVIRHFLRPWTYRMAWRDSRASRRRLLFFSTSIVLGIAALVAVGSFGRNLEQAVEEQAKTLLGADLIISSRQPFTPEEERLFVAIGGIQSRQISFSSMIYFPNNGSTRLVQVRALSGDFPFYGYLETQPVQAAQDFRHGGSALVEDTLLLQYNAHVGDPVRLGQFTTRLGGSLQKVPGETVVFATIAPRVYIALSDLAKTGLVRDTSLAAYRVAFKLPGTNVTQLVKAIKPQLDQLRLAHSTVQKRKEELGNSLDNLYNYLNLVGFIALLLGGVGVASAIHVHIKQKLDTVAVLRCLGCSIGQTFAVYLLQGLALGMAGAIAGTALGLAIHQLVPKVVADFLPFQVSFAPSWRAAAEAMLLGFAICLLFSLLPLLGVRRVSPLAALRSSYESRATRGRDPLLWVIYLLIALGVTSFALAHTHRWQHGLGFAAGLGVAFGLLAGVAHALTLLVKKFAPPTLPYVWRQGLANLYRPNNRTVLLVLSIGLGAFLLLTGYLTKETLLRQLVSDRQSHQANTVLFDIQPDQRESTIALLRSHQLPVLDEAPIITMRLASIKGRTVEAILADKKKTIPNWVLRREYRSSFHDRLRTGEKIVAGQWRSAVTNGTTPVPISVEADIGKDLGVGLGDEIVFDVQGVPLSTRVASLREVDWRLVQPNFFVVFPRGVLEAAPATHVITTRVESPEEAATLQREMVQKFPNVSAIDLRLILQTVDALLSKVSFVVRFMALFVVLTGLLVLIGAILTGRYQRLRESILLRTLGASRRQIFQILLAEYCCLGVLAALTGIALAVGASWALAAFVFQAKFAPSFWPLLVALLAVTGLTMLIGLLASRSVTHQPPLEILRAEA
jgi:putative ABC transport system permease protein